VAEPVAQRIGRASLVLIAAALAVLGPPAATGAAPPRGGRPAPATGASAAEAAPLETVLDAAVRREMAAAHVPGAVVVVVHDGAVVFARGYGYRDLERRLPVEADATRFHAMSVSKVFTATAIMQLAEQGRLDLQADVGRSLRRVPFARASAAPVTTAQLLTHTAGFDDDLDDLARVAASPAALVPLGDYLALHPPVQIRPPGAWYGYSNAAFDVLGAIVEDVAGQPFAAYAQEHILQPLDMRHSSFLPPPPDAADVARDYRYVGGAYRPRPPHYFGDAPARGLLTTGADMAHFLLAHLQDGRDGDARILAPATAREMHATHFTYRPGEPGMAYGFQEFTSRPGGVRELWKDGRDQLHNTSMLVLVPDRRAGWFVAANADDGQQVSGEVSRLLTAYYAPAPPDSAPPPPPPPGGPPAGPAAGVTPAAAAPAARARAAQIAGVYRDTGYSHRTLAKLLLLTRGDYPRVVVGADGRPAIRTSAADPAAPSPLVELAPGLFAAEHPPDGVLHFLFLEDERGRVTHMALGPETYERLAWYETVRAQRAFLGGFLLAFLIAATAWPAGALLRRRRGPAAGRPSPLGWARALPTTVAALNLGLLLALVWILPGASDLGLEYRVPAWLVALLVVPIATTTLTSGMVAVGALAWRQPAWSARERAGYALLVAVAVAFIPFLRYWNLLGVRW
jgi:CubicO group peptidase (beta-lactamase class C family)